MKNSGLADSPFFRAPQMKNEVLAPPLSSPPPHKERADKIKKSKKPKPVPPSNSDTMTPRYHESLPPRVHGVMLEVVRKAVREFGKEAATHRFTQSEKKEIGDLIYTYKNQGIKTSENEITRIAVNFIFEDYKENGGNSVLYQILNALNG
ncbi:hypothetical protein C4565_06140 [Candidatus Parcubacteria bacterium]|nr:MAG: hypothetical protein C4565_06140 [Candidatus Parcubacteria bacterium]